MILFDRFHARLIVTFPPERAAYTNALNAIWVGFAVDGARPESNQNKH